jgi:hypothetical protein
MDGLSSDDDTSDDESQAWSLVGDEELGELREAEKLQGGASSLFGVTHEHPSVTPEDSSRSTNVNGTHLDATPAAESTGLDPITSANLEFTSPSDTSDSAGQQSTDSEVENQKHEAGLPLPTPPLPAEDDESQQDLSSAIESPTSVEVSEHETSGDANGTNESNNSTMNEVDTGQSSPPDGGPDTPQAVPVVSTPEQPSSSPPEENQAATAPVTDEASLSLPSDVEENLSEVTHPSYTVFTEPSEPAVNEPPEERPDLKPVTNETPADLAETSERTHAEQPLPSLSNPVPHDPEVHGESVPTTGDSAIGVRDVEEELGPINLENSPGESVPTTNNSAPVHTVVEEIDPIAPTTSAQHDDIPVLHAVHSPVNVSVELDISASVSPSSSTRSVFSDSPFCNRHFPEFHLLSPVSPALCLDKSNLLLFREGR